MTKRIDMTGRRFGRWLVKSYAGKQKWNCQCDCGTEKAVDGRSLRRGISNGCIKCHPARSSRKTHGEAKTRLHNIWLKMRGRCANPTDPAYPRYGGRGIKVCEEWEASYERFAEWARSNGYQGDLTIDRIDNDGNYKPSNCRWASYAEQNRNYGRNRPVNYRGRSVLVCDLAEEVGLPQDILKNRIFRYGWSVEEAVSTPVLKKGQRR